MLSIGEFSRATSLSVKALRLYHEQNLLVPSLVDRETNYRYYDFKDLERAKIIARLRSLMFSLSEIKEILAKCHDDGDTLAFLERQRLELETRIKEYRRVTTSLEAIIRNERDAVGRARQMQVPQEMTVPSMLVACIKTVGRYEMSGNNFAKIGRAMGRHISGKPLNLYFDEEHKDGDATFESCMPIAKMKKAAGIDVRELAGGSCISAFHRGPYAELGQTYARLFGVMNERGLVAQLPSREVYVKGPGMLFKGNPNRYVTDVQIMIRG